MSWVADKATLVSALTSAGYSEIPNLKAVENSSALDKNKNYELRPIGAEFEHYSNSSTRAVYKALLRVIYINRSSSAATNAARDANFDLFMTLMGTLNSNSVFVSFIGDAEFTDVSEFQSIGKIEFYMGAKEC